MYKQYQGYNPHVVVFFREVHVDEIGGFPLNKMQGCPESNIMCEATVWNGVDQTLPIKINQHMYVWMAICIWSEL